MEGDNVPVGEARPIVRRVAIHTAIAVAGFWLASWFFFWLGVDAIGLILFWISLCAPWAFYSELSSELGKAARKREQQAQHARSVAERN